MTSTSRIADNLQPNSIYFESKYTPQIAHLEENLSKKLCRVFYDIFSTLTLVIGLIRWAVSTLAFPSGSKIFTCCKNKDSEVRFRRLWNNHFDLIPLTIKTPDGVLLKGTYFKKKDLPSDANTLIYFNPNAATSKEMLNGTSTPTSLLNHIAQNDRPCHFITFDYRGSGESSSSAWRSKDLVLDGEAVLQLVEDRFKAPSNRIHVYGQSLGGGVSFQAAKNHNIGAYVSERSFTTLANCADTNNTRTGQTGFNTFAVQFAEWDLDTANNWKDLKARKLVLYHPEDPVMQHENLSNVARKFFDRVINLKNENPTLSPQLNHHCVPVHLYNSNLPKRIIDFVLNHPDQ